MTDKIFSRRRLKYTNPSKSNSPARDLILAFRLALALILTLPVACGEQVTPKERAKAARALSAVMLAIQYGTDSTDRVRLADSASRVNGFDDWTDLRAEIDRMSLFTDDFRQVLDTAQKHLDSAAALARDSFPSVDSAIAIDTSLTRIDSAPGGLRIPGLPNMDLPTRKGPRRGAPARTK